MKTIIFQDKAVVSDQKISEPLYQSIHNLGTQLKKQDGSIDTIKIEMYSKKDIKKFLKTNNIKNSN